MLIQGKNTNLEYAYIILNYKTFITYRTSQTIGKGQKNNTTLNDK